MTFSTLLLSLKMTFKLNSLRIKIDNSKFFNIEIYRHKDGFEIYEYVQDWEDKDFKTVKLNAQFDSIKKVKRFLYYALSLRDEKCLTSFFAEANVCKSRFKHQITFNALELEKQGDDVDGRRKALKNFISNCELILDDIDLLWAPLNDVDKY